MRVVTIVSLGACALFGLGALVVAKTMLPATAAAKSAPMVGTPVVVAKTPLKFGDRLDATKVEILKLPADAVPEGAFTTVAQILAQDHGGPPVTLTSVAARELLLPAKLSGPGARASIAAEIGDNMRAYTIKVTDVTGVGGHALPGDHVDVVLMRDLTPQAATHNYVSEVVIQNIKVLGVDLNEDQAANKPSTPNTATLEVSVPEAQKLAVAADLGKLSLALRKTGSTEVAQTTPMHTSAFVTGGGGGGAPRAPRAFVRRAVSQPGPSAPALIQIVEGGPNGAGKSHPRPAPKAADPAPPAAPAMPGNPVTATVASTARPS